VAVARDTSGSHTAISGSRAGRGSAACQKAVAVGLMWVTPSPVVAVASTVLGQGPITVDTRQQQQQQEEGWLQGVQAMVMRTRLSAVMVAWLPLLLVPAEVQACHQQLQGVGPHQQPSHLQQVATIGKAQHGSMQPRQAVLTTSSMAQLLSGAILWRCCVC
jgi:hypothetical protein